MGETLGRLGTFFLGGFKTLILWGKTLIFGTHSGIDYALVHWHGIVAGVLESALFIGILYFIWSRVWPKKVVNKPGQSPVVTHRAQPQRLIILWSVLILIFLVACFAAP